MSVLDFIKKRSLEGKNSMENARFKIAEEVKNFKLPFVLSEEALTDWLNNLMVLDDYAESVKKMYCLIETLNKTQIPVQQRIIFLEKICTCIKQIVNRVDKKQDDLAFPLQEEESRELEMIAWSYLGLARGLCFVAKTIDDKGVKAYSWYQALFSLAQAYLKMTAVYRSPSKGFWLLCYQIYFVAEKEGVLDVSLGESGLEDETIAKIFKQIIVFSLSNPNQFRARDMKVVFNFLGKYVAQVNISSESNNVVFDLDKDCEPRLVARLNNYQLNAATRSIETVSMAKHIYQGVKQGESGLGLIEGLNKALLVRVLKSLGGTQARKFTRVDETGVSTGIAGFDYLSSYLRAKDGEVKAKAKNNHEQTQDWALLSKGYEHMHQKQSELKEDIKKNEQIKNIFQLTSGLSVDMDVWGSTHTDRNTLIENVETSDVSLINSSIKGYALCWADKANRVKLGDVLGLVFSDSERLEITIIRRLQQLQSGAVRLGVEVIGLESDSVYTYRPNDKEHGRWGILLPRIKGLKELDSLVYKTGDYELGEFIFIKQKKLLRRCRLTKLINSTQAISHAELFFIEESKSM